MTQNNEMSSGMKIKAGCCLRGEWNHLGPWLRRQECGSLTGTVFFVVNGLDNETSRTLNQTDWMSEPQKKSLTETEDGGRSKGDIYFFIYMKVSVCWLITVRIARVFHVTKSVYLWQQSALSQEDNRKVVKQWKVPRKVRRVFPHFLLMPTELDLRCCKSAGCSVLVWHSSFPANHNNKTRRTKGRWWSQEAPVCSCGTFLSQQKGLIGASPQSSLGLGCPLQAQANSQRFSQYLLEAFGAKRSTISSPKNMNQTRQNVSALSKQAWFSK